MLRLNAKNFLLLMIEKQLDYTEVANLTGLSLKTISRSIKGPCRYATLGKIAKALNVPVTDLIED